MGRPKADYVCLGSSWDVKACKQKAGETLCEYIHHFFRQCNELPDIVDADVIGAFISSMTNEALVHELGRYKLWTTRELLDLATSHPSGKEAVCAIFYKYKGKAQAEPVDEAKSAPQFESRKCICICARIKQRYAQNHKNGTQIYNKRF